MRYWIIQANPTKYRIFEAFAAGYPRDWRVPNWRAIAPDDEFALWVSGPESGVYAFGVVTEKPEPRIGDPDPYWVDPEEGERPARYVRIRIEDILARPILKAELAQDPGFADAGIMVQWWGANPFPVTESQWQVLLSDREYATSEQGHSVRIAEALAGMSPEHRRRLAWFHEHKGQVLPIPGPLEDGQLLVAKPKGIYKPRDLPYALSIRINLDSPYADGMPVQTPGSGWLLSYHQENADPADRDKAYANRGLMQCIVDRVPVGVLRERAAVGRQTRYEVLGLAVPVRWSDGYFFLESVDPPGQPTADVVTDVLEATARTHLDQEIDATTVPNDDYDARLRTYQQIIARRGQQAFRAALVEAYRAQCAVTGCDATWALEAAHLRPYRGPESNIVTNGLLLRCDIHTLFDLRLLAIHPATRGIVVSKLLVGTQYEPLSTYRVADPAADRQRPSQEALDRNWQDFTETEETR